jgi:hypothetical protein
MKETVTMAVKSVLPVLASLVLYACGANSNAPPAAAGAAGDSTSKGGKSGSSGGGSESGGNKNGGSKNGGTGGGEDSSGSSQGAEGPGPAQGGEPSHGSEDNPPPSDSSGAVGVWEDVTPKGIDLSEGNDNYGVQDVQVDPVRPQDLYAFVCYQGVWRSTDYGMTWKQVNKTEDWGKPWGTAIQPTLDRDPKTAPIIYQAASLVPGILKSADFGVTWVKYDMPDEIQNDRGYPYSVDIDPYDPEHILIAFHESPDVAESTTGGKSWKLIKAPAGNGGTSFYPFFINTGNAETTRKTWLAIPQVVVPGHAIRTEDGGKTFKDLGGFQHEHGSAQIVDLGKGTLYLSATSPDGIHKSTDYGKTWSMLSDVSTGVVAAGKTQLYTSVGLNFGTPDQPLDPKLFTAKLTADKTWTSMSAPKMYDGAKRIAVTRDASHEIAVSGNWHAGIWRYKQP